MNQRGATIVESMVCMLLLFMVLFALLQIFQWTMAKMVCEYSSFYAAKASAYGFADTIVENAARVAAIAASGQDTGSDKEKLQHDYRGTDGSIDIDAYRKQLAIRAQNYMVNSDTNIDYAYWRTGQAAGTSAVLDIFSDNASPTITAKVRVLNMPLLDPGVSAFINNIKTVDIPKGESKMYNHAQKYLER